MDKFYYSKENRGNDNRGEEATTVRAQGKISEGNAEGKTGKGRRKEERSVRKEETNNGEARGDRAP